MIKFVVVKSTTNRTKRSVRSRHIDKIGILMAIVIIKLVVLRMLVMLLIILIK